MVYGPTKVSRALGIMLILSVLIVPSGLYFFSLQNAAFMEARSEEHNAIMDSTVDVSGGLNTTRAVFTTTEVDGQCNETVKYYTRPDTDALFTDRLVQTGWFSYDTNTKIDSHPCTETKR